MAKRKARTFAQEQWDYFFGRSGIAKNPLPKGVVIVTSKFVPVESPPRKKARKKK